MDRVFTSTKKMMTAFFDIEEAPYDRKADL